GAGKSVLLSSWMAARPGGTIFWLSCDTADADPVRFWAGFIEAVQARGPWFGAGAAGLVAVDGTACARVMGSAGDAAAGLAPGSAAVGARFPVRGGGGRGRERRGRARAGRARPVGLVGWCRPAAAAAPAPDGR